MIDPKKFRDCSIDELRKVQEQILKEIRQSSHLEDEKSLLFDLAENEIKRKVKIHNIDLAAEKKAKEIIRTYRRY